MENKAYLSLGSNMGKREDYLRQALSALEATGQIKITNFSSIYETEPVGYTDQADFLNMAIEIATSYSANDLLDECLQIEKTLGRKRILHWGPRTVDIDVILYNQNQINTENLIVPHPRMHVRAFVLVPLAEMNPTLNVPGLNQTVKQLLMQVDQTEVRLWKGKIGQNVDTLFQTVTNED